jgi:hypothetical protein
MDEIEPRSITEDSEGLVKQVNFLGLLYGPIGNGELGEAKRSYRQLAKGIGQYNLAVEARAIKLKWWAGEMMLIEEFHLQAMERTRLIGRAEELASWSKRLYGQVFHAVPFDDRANQPFKDFFDIASKLADNLERAYMPAASG